MLREYNEMKEEKKLSVIYRINIVDINIKIYERNDIETIVDNNRILWLIVKHIEAGLDHKNMWEITIQYQSDHRKNRYELIEEQKKQCNRIFIDEKWAIKVIMHCRTTSAYKFRARLWFKQYGIILTKDQSLITKITSLFEGENMQTI